MVGVGLLRSAAGEPPHDKVLKSKNDSRGGVNVGGVVNPRVEAATGTFGICRTDCADADAGATAVMD